MIVLPLSMILSCKKRELPEADSGTPVFMVESRVNATAVNLVAGKDRYYMYTSYALDNIGVNVLKGTLRQEDCENCNHEFTIAYRDSKLRNNLLINDINDVLKTGSYFYRNGVDTLGNTLTGAVVNFTAYAPAGSNYSYSWDFGDGTGSTQMNPAHHYNEPADYTVCLTVSQAGFPSKTICNVITMDTTCRFQFNHTASQNFVSVYTIGGANSFSWNFGDGSATQLAGSTTAHTYAQAGIYRITLKDSLSVLNCTNSFQKDILVGNFTGNELAAAFNYSINTTPPVQVNPIDSAFRKIVIEYSNPQGIKYSTYHPYKLHNQSYNAFNITAAEPFQNNSDGKKTFKMEGSFKAWFFNNSNPNDSIFIETNKFTMGVAYP
jgi:PKD repeat protein